MIGWMSHDRTGISSLEIPSQSLQWQSGFLGKNLVSLVDNAGFTIVLRQNV